MNKQDNYYIKKVREQFYNTGDLLMRIGIVSNVLDLIERNDGNHYYFTWQEADDTLYSNGDSLLYIEQFLEIFKNRQYHFILKDGSLIRVSFKFSGSLLESQNLLWWPCPIRDFQKLCSNPEQTD